MFKICSCNFAFCIQLHFLASKYTQAAKNTFYSDKLNTTGVIYFIAHRKSWVLTVSSLYSATTGIFDSPTCWATKIMYYFINNTTALQIPAVLCKYCGDLQIPSAL